MAKIVMLIALLAVSTCNSEPACLLQNTFSSSDISVDVADMVEATDEASLAMAPESAILFESDALETASIEKLVMRSKSRSRSGEAYLVYLNRKSYGLERAHNVSNMKIDELVKSFISQQSGSQDACSSQLMEAKHQLNQIHAYVMDLVMQVNTTEMAILALDKEMQNKIKEIETLDKWKEEELAICEKKRQEYIEMYIKLSGEMKEMKQIASPGVAMDVKTGAVITAENPVALAQMKPHVHSTKDMTEIQFLIKGTQSAARQYMHCMTETSEEKEYNSKPQRSVVVDGREIQVPEGVRVRTPSTRKKGKGKRKAGAASANVGFDINGVDSLRDEDDQAAIDAAEAIESSAASPEKCAAEKKVLEETYVKTYVELSRLKDEYDTLANSTACVDNVESLYKSRKAPLQEDIDRLIKDIDKKTRALQGLRPRLERATEAEAELRKHIATLTEECAELPETVSNLDKVREAIEALHKCPGLGRVKFSIPKTVKWLEFDLMAKEMTDEEQDKAMNAACDKAFSGTRAAEVSEISFQTVEGIPETNTAEFPLIGACPNCAGDAAIDLPSKHKRICWRPGKELKCAAKSSNCASGRKAVLCVTDRDDIREIPGQDQ